MGKVWVYLWVSIPMGKISILTDALGLEVSECMYSDFDGSFP
jgi:hypothetical protein